MALFAGRHGSALRSQFVTSNQKPQSIRRYVKAQVKAGFVSVPDLAVTRWVRCLRRSRTRRRGSTLLDRTRGMPRARRPHQGDRVGRSECRPVTPSRPGAPSVRRLGADRRAGARDGARLRFPEQAHIPASFYGHGRPSISFVNACLVVAYSFDPTIPHSRAPAVVVGC
jgi:hypothetical protein